MSDSIIAENVGQEHGEMLDALRSNEDKRAAELAEQHIKHQMETIIRNVNEKKVKEMYE